MQANARAAEYLTRHVTPPINVYDVANGGVIQNFWSVQRRP